MFHKLIHKQYIPLEVLTHPTRMSIIFDENKRVSRIINPNIHLMLGITDKQILHLKEEEIFHYIMPENSCSFDKLLKALEHVHKEGTARYIEYTATSPIDKQKHYMLCNITKFEKKIYCSAWEIDMDNLNHARYDYLSKNIKDLNLALKTINQSVWQYDIRANRFYKLFGDFEIYEGFTKEEIFSLIEGDKETIRKIFLAVAEGKQEEGNYIMQFKPRGEKNTIYSKTSLTLQRDEQGRPESIIGTYVDITQQLLIEQDSASVTRSIMQSSRMRMCYILIPQGNIYMDSVSGFKDVGLTFDQYTDSVMDNDRPVFKKVMGELISGALEATSLRFTRQSLTTTMIETYQLYVHGEKNAMGKVFRLVGLEVNITDDVKRLEQISTNLNLALDVGHLTVWKFDFKKEIFHIIHGVTWNDSQCQMQTNIEMLHPDDRERQIKLFDSFKRGECENAIEHFHYDFGNGMRTYECKMIVKKNEYGEIEGIISAQRDVTDELQTLQELTSAKQKAEESDMLKSSFLANMSHEIRTPLNAIVGFSDLLATGVVDDEDEKKNFIELIHTNTDLLLRLINDILDLSKIESNSLRINPKEIDAKKLAEDAISTFKQQLSESKKPIQLIARLPHEVVPCFHDPDRVSQIINNLLSNALKYTSEGSVTITLTHNENELYFRVKDTGIGIDFEQQHKVFSRFSKIDNFAQGNGLGLAICKAMVEKANGTIGFESAGKGLGSTFWFKLPIRYTYLKNEDEG